MSVPAGISASDSEGGPRNLHYECAGCGMWRTLPLTDASRAQGCPTCGKVTYLMLFPALLRSQEGARAENVVQDTESSCFFHPAKRAMAVCEACGRLICATCEIDMGSQKLCPACIEEGARSGALEPLKTERARYDQIALSLAVLPLLFFYLTLFTAPIALYFCFRHKQQKTGVLPRGRAVMITALVFALFELLGWAFVLLQILL